MDEPTALFINGAFEKWSTLTDAYAAQVAAMEQGKPGARDEAARLGREIRTLSPQADAWAWAAMHARAPVQS